MFDIYLCYAVLSVPCSLVDTCWGRADPLRVVVSLSLSQSGMVLDCIDSCSLPSSLLFLYNCTVKAKCTSIKLSRIR